MSEYLSKEEIRKWRSSLERITLEEYAARLGKVIQEEKQIFVGDIGAVVHDLLLEMAVAIYQTLAVVIDQRLVGTAYGKGYLIFLAHPVKIELVQPVPQQRRHGRIVSHGEHLPYEGIGKKLSLYIAQMELQTQIPFYREFVGPDTAAGLLLLIPHYSHHRH